MATDDASLGIEDQMIAMPALAGDEAGILADGAEAKASAASDVHQGHSLDHTHDLHGLDELGVGGEKGGATAHWVFLGCGECFSPWVMR